MNQVGDIDPEMVGGLGLGLGHLASGVEVHNKPVPVACFEMALEVGVPVVAAAAAAVAAGPDGEVQALIAGHVNLMDSHSF